MIVDRTRWAVGELPNLIWCIGFKVDPIYDRPTDIRVYIKLRGQLYCVDDRHILHMAASPQYWIQCEDIEKK